MKTSITFLKYQNTLEETINKIEQTSADFIHVDVMDGQFVSHKFLDVDECLNLLKNKTKPLDVHLMVNDPTSYINALASLNIKYITIHAEINGYISDIISLIKSKNILAGIAINPDTPVSKIAKYLGDVDNVLVMGVNPGQGGQSLIIDTVNKVDELKSIREENNYHYLISFDGGVNKDTCRYLKNVDILVVGSYVSLSDDYEESINSLKV